MSSNKSNELIDITIKIGNSRDYYNGIMPGRSYYFTKKRNTTIKELLNDLSENFTGDDLIEIKKYSLFTKKVIRLYDENTVEDSFTNKEDSYLDIMDKDESIFYALLI